jgi:hypothetical protein
MALRISAADAAARGLGDDAGRLGQIPKRGKADSGDAARDSTRRPNKFHAQRTTCGGGHTHSSKREAGRCDQLRLLERGGHIRNLEQQPRYYFVSANGRRVVDERGQAVRYTADFRYEERLADGAWRLVTEEVKGPFRDRAWQLRRAFFRHFHPDVELREVAA